jgi:hypothetical protein
VGIVGQCDLCGDPDPGGRVAGMIGMHEYGLEGHHISIR